MLVVLVPVPIIFLARHQVLADCHSQVDCLQGITGLIMIATVVSLPGIGAKMNLVLLQSFSFFFGNRTTI